MFEIKCRIVDDFLQLRTLETEEFDREYNNVSGFVLVEFGQHREGSGYHENPLHAEEIGLEWINYWLSAFLEVGFLLFSTAHVASFREIEKANRWIVLRLDNKKIIANVGVSSINKGMTIQEDYEQFTFIEPIDYEISCNEFYVEVMKATKKFLDDLKAINTKLSQSKMAKELYDDLVKFDIAYYGANGTR